jgi:high-affinity nickel-transport protein
MLFLLAASLGGTGRGFLGLLAFAAGLILMNGAMTAMLGGVYNVSAGHGHQTPVVFRWVALAGAAYSLIIGIIFLLGASNKLPPLG